ncbi:MAG: hypothetical protein RL490_1399, partial [Pseudomonadota bacterium]
MKEKKPPAAGAVGPRPQSIQGPTYPQGHVMLNLSGFAGLWLSIHLADWTVCRVARWMLKQVQH